MTNDLVKRLRRDLASGLSASIGDTEEAADRIEELERIEAQMPAILEYLEHQADVVDGDGVPHPNKAMALPLWLKHAMWK